MHSEAIQPIHDVSARPALPNVDVTARPPHPSEEGPSSLSLFLGPLGSLLQDQEVTEISINQPGVAFVERQSGWTQETLSFATFDWCMAIAKLVANHTRQRISANEPLL